MARRSLYPTATESACCNSRSPGAWRLCSAIREAPATRSPHTTTKSSPTPHSQRESQHKATKTESAKRVPASPPDLKAKGRKQLLGPGARVAPVDRELFHWRVFPPRSQAANRPPLLWKEIPSFFPSVSSMPVSLLQSLQTFQRANESL